MSNDQDKKNSPLIDNVRPFVPKDHSLDRDRFLDYFSHGLKRLLLLKFQKIELNQTQHSVEFFEKWFKIQNDEILFWDVYAFDKPIGYISFAKGFAYTLITRALGGVNENPP